MLEKHRRKNWWIVFDSAERIQAVITECGRQPNAERIARAFFPDQKVTVESWWNATREQRREGIQALHITPKVRERAGVAPRLQPPPPLPPLPFEKQVELLQAKFARVATAGGAHA
jgi:hypothetical protein